MFVQVEESEWLYLERGIVDNRGRHAMARRGGDEIRIGRVAIGVSTVWSAHRSRYDGEATRRR